jgi:hypothetical protein
VPPRSAVVCPLGLAVPHGYNQATAPLSSRTNPKNLIFVEATEASPVGVES